ncbi:MAG TPA: hypothetical protein VFZ65_20930 [Planctomycetota bacterium]|nr:hypothetical protein [Planctomycetota bacterium]
MNDDEDLAGRHLLAMALSDERRPADLEARILARLAADPTVARAHAGRWLTAAALLLGTIAVVGVSLVMPHDAASKPALAWAQDPQAKQAAAVPKVTDADLPERARYSFDGRPALDCLMEVAKASGLPLVSDVREQIVHVALDAATPRQALEAIAREADAHLESYGGVLTVVPGKRAAETLLTMHREATPVTTLLDLIAHEAHLNLVVGPDVAGAVAVDVTRCAWRDLLPLLAGAVGAEVEGLGTVLHVRRKAQAPAPRTYFAYDRTPTAKVLDTIDKITGTKLIDEGGITGSVSVRVKDQPALDVRQAIAATQGCEVIEVRGQPVWRRSGR